MIIDSIRVNENYTARVYAKRALESPSIEAMADAIPKRVNTGSVFVEVHDIRMAESTSYDLMVEIESDNPQFCADAARRVIDWLNLQRWEVAPQQ